MVGVNGAELLVTLPPETGEDEVARRVPVQVLPERSWNVTDPVATLEMLPRAKVALSYTDAPSVTVGVHAVQFPSVFVEHSGVCVLASKMAVEMIGVKKMALVARARSCEPVDAPSRELRAMWYGEPEIPEAPLAKPQLS